ncbi:MAG: O-antigen ligase family protein [Anaerolineae bacterium]|nr:O-antigen ligase family protein [Anaerolineae bacterium]
MFAHHLRLPRNVQLALYTALAALLTYLLPVQATLILWSAAALVVLSAIVPLAVVAPLLILAPLRTLISTESAWFLPLDIGQILFLLALAVVLMARVARRQTAMCPVDSGVFGFLLTFLVVLGMTAFSAWSLEAWLSEWLKWWVIAITAYATATLLRGHELWLAAFLVISALANALLGIYIFLGGSGADHLLIANRFFRAFGSFGQPNPFGGFMGLVLPLALALSFWSAGRWWRGRAFDQGIRTIFFAGASLILGLGLFVSWSRGAWLAAAVAVLAVAFAWPRKVKHSLAAVGVLISLLALAWSANLLPSSVIERVGSIASDLFKVGDVRGVEITSDNYAVIERLAHWQAAWNMAEAHPWLGVGLGNYEVAYPVYSLVNWPLALGHAHNYYLNILAEGGMIGLSAYVIFSIGTLWLLWRVRQSNQGFNRALGVGLLGSWVYLAVHSLLDNLYVNNIFIHLGVMLGILATLHDQTRPS